MPYIQRSPEDGSIVGVFAHSQPNLAEEFISEDDPLVQNRGRSLEQTREMVRDKIRSHATQLRTTLTSQCSPQEAAAWIIKLTEVRAYRLNSVAESAPILAAEAGYRRISLVKMIGLVEAKAEPFLEAEAKISGRRGWHEDRIDKLTTAKKLLDYDWRSGWE